MDKGITGPVTQDGNGITVSLLASELGPYPDDLAIGRYEFPETLVPGWDEASIEATKEARRTGLPVFLILRWEGGGNRRSVRLVRIAGWNNTDRHFLLEPYLSPSITDSVDRPPKAKTKEP